MFLRIPRYDSLSVDIHVRNTEKAVVCRQLMVKILYQLVLMNKFFLSHLHVHVQVLARPLLCLYASTDISA